MRGSPCRAAIDKLPTKTLDSPFSVSSEESLGNLNDFDLKSNEEIEGADLSILFDEAGAIPFQVPQNCLRICCP